MSEAKIEETICEDRISELPEDLQVHILSLLPIKDAVTTMFLSKQWFLIWTMLRTLKYIDEKDEPDENKKSVWWFLDKSLQFHKAHLDKKHVIENLLIELGSECPTNADVGKWIAYAVDCGVRDLKFRLSWSKDPISLPKSLYSCETLTHLSLSHKILVDFPSSCLLSLIELKLSYVMYKDEDSLVRFLSNCLVLKCLEVKRKKKDNVRRFTVRVPSLRDLSYTNYSHLHRNHNDVEDTRRCLVIDTPALINLTIIDYSEDSYLVESMPDLHKAIIHVESLLDSDKFVTSLSSVLSLKFNLNDAVVNLCSIIKFSQLTKLKIYPKKSDWLEPLMLLLGNAPKLRKLRVNCVHINTPKDLPPVWNQPSSVPTCLSSQLEKFKWIKYGDSLDEKEFFTYLIANSKCLKSAIISLRSSCFDGIEEYNMIIQKMKDIARVFHDRSFS